MSKESTAKSVVYVVFDKTDGNFHKPFVSIHHVEAKAKQEVDDLRAKVNSDYAKNLIKYEAIECKS